MEGFRAIEINKKTFVLKDIDRKQVNYSNGNGESVSMPDANFKGTGMALCGVLKQNQSFTEFVEKYNSKQSGKRRGKNDNN